MRWLIETSFEVNTPAYVEAADVPELRGWVQARADAISRNPDRLPIGELNFRYELDHNGDTELVKVHFLDRHGRRRRFMRLRRENGEYDRSNHHRIMRESMQQRKDDTMSDPSSPNYGRNLFRDLRTHTSGRTDLSRRREEDQRAQRRMFGDEAPNGEKY